MFHIHNWRALPTPAVGCHNDIFCFTTVLIDVRNEKKLSCSKSKQLCHVSERLTFSSCFDSFHCCTQLLICMQKKRFRCQAFKIHSWKKTFFAHKSIASTILQLINKPIEDLVMLLLPLCSVYVSLPRNSLTQLVKLLV